MQARLHIAAAFAGLLLAGAAHATPVVLTFDDIDSISDGYGGITGWEAVGQLMEDATGNRLFTGREGSLLFGQDVRLLGMDFVSWTAMGLGGFRLFHQGSAVYEFRETDGDLLDPIWRDVAYGDPVDRIEFFGSTDGFLLDNLTYTAVTAPPNPVDEPGQLALMLAGLAAMGMLTRLRRGS